MTEIIYQRHSDKRTLYLRKVIKLLKEGRSKANICRELPISRETIDNWLKQIGWRRDSGDSNGGTEMKSKKSKPGSGAKKTSAGNPTATSATADSGSFIVGLDTEDGAFSVKLNDPLGCVDAKVMELPGYVIDADLIEEDEEEEISTKGLSPEQLENLVKELNRKPLLEKRRADRESANVEAMKELIGEAEKTFKIDILKNPLPDGEERACTRQAQVQVGSALQAA